MTSLISDFVKRSTYIWSANYKTNRELDIYLWYSPEYFS